MLSHYIVHVYFEIEDAPGPDSTARIFSSPPYPNLSKLHARICISIVTMAQPPNVPRRKSLAALSIHVENNLRTLGNGLEGIRNEADSILTSDNPTKRQRRALRDAANSLMAIQASTSADIPDLIPKDCSKYSVNRIRSEENH